MANIVPAAGIFEGSSLIVKLYHAAKTIKVHKERLSGLARQCDSLLSTVREHSSRLVGTAAATEADEIERSIERISRRVSEWASYNDKIAFFKQNEIQVGIDECYRELTTCSDRFTMAMAVLAHSDNRVRETHRQRDFAQLYDMMVRLLEEVQTTSRSMPPEEQQLTELLTLEEQVVTVDAHQPSPQSTLPPRPRPRDLTGKVSKISQQPDSKGSLLDFYLGEWDDEEHATLGRPRDQSPGSQMRFKQWVEASAGLHHRHLLGVAGHVTIGDSVYSVSPWMKNGNIREYIRINANVDRMRLLSDVASAVEYLHENEIIHGDICGKNVLMNGDGRAFVCGFNLFGYLEPSFDMTRARWFSPERISSTGLSPPTKKGDVWSFASLAIEVFTGQDPYSSHQDFYVPVLLNSGTPPADRESTTVDISSKMWDLLESCWQTDLTTRPSMSDVQLAIRGMLPRKADREASTFPDRVLDPVTIIDSASIHDSDTSPPSTPPVIEVLQSSARTPPRSSKPSGRPTDIIVPAPHRPSNASSLISTLTPLPEEYLPASLSASLDLLGISGSPRSALTHSPTNSLSSLPPEPRRQMSDISSLPTTASTGELGKSPKRWQFPMRRSQTTPYGPPDPQPRRGSSSSSESIPHQGRPSKSRTNSVKTTGASAGSHPARSVTSLVLLSQPRKWVPVSPEVVLSMERATNDTECILRRTNDGRVSAGNLEGFVHLITVTPDSSRDNDFKSTFLTIYQLFATSDRLFAMLKRRFESTSLDSAPMSPRYLILLFIERWLRKGFEDLDLKVSSKIKEFVRAISYSESSPEREGMEAKANEIARLVDDPENVCLRQPGPPPRLRVESARRPPDMTPSDVAAALTAIEGKRFKNITYWDYVNYILRGPPEKAGRIDVFNAVHDLVTNWVKRTILDLDHLDERMEKYEEWINTAQACRNLNNFSSASAIVVALTSLTITRLALTCESKSGRVLQNLCRELMSGAYQNTLKQLETNNLVPWLETHITTLNLTFAHSNPIVEVEGRPLLDFKQFSEVAELIDSLVEFSPALSDKPRKGGVLEFVEYSLRSSICKDAQAAETRSTELGGQEKVMVEHRARMRALGIPWSPQRRK